MPQCVSLCFAELSIENRAEVADNERRSFTDGDSSEAGEDKMMEALNDNGIVDVVGSRYTVTVSRHEPICTTLTSAALSPQSQSIRHSVSDSLVYHADTELSSSREVLTDPVTRVNGCCKAAEETSVPVCQVSLCGELLNYCNICISVHCIEYSILDSRNGTFRL